MQHFCIENLTWIDYDNGQMIDVSGEFLVKYDETDVDKQYEHHYYYYYVNKYDSNLRWQLINLKWIYGDTSLNYLICNDEKLNIEMPFFCKDWIYLNDSDFAHYPNHWKFEIGNCSINSINNEIQISMDSIHNDTIITVVLFCTVLCLLITTIVIFKLYHHIKDDLKYHITQTYEIPNEITNNQDNEDNDENNENDLKRMDQQQHITQIMDDDQDEDLYINVSDNAECTSPGMPVINDLNDINHINHITQTIPKDMATFRLPIPYYRSDRKETVISMDGQEGGLNSVKSWIVTKVNIPSSNEKYYKIFLENGFETLDIIKTIKREDLMAIGINKRGHQNKILLEVDALSDIK